MEVQGRVSIYVTNEGNTTVMDAVVLICVPLGSSTDQLDESLAR
jgi:hypothetical protein